jgi:hypothetical protein
MAFDADRDAIHRNSRRFLEDIQYKDFAHAAVFHTDRERNEKNIAQLIEKKFLVKPELLDIRHFEVLRVDLSGEGNRGKSVSNVTVKFLNTKETRDVECVLYWKKENDAWYMDLQSSL